MFTEFPSHRRLYKRILTNKIRLTEQSVIQIKGLEWKQVSR